MFPSVPRAWSLETVHAVLQLKAEGLTDRQVSRRTRVSIHTIRLWRRRGLPKRVDRLLHPTPCCTACGEPIHNFADVPVGAYAYLLGLYLGDGCLGRAQGSWVLRIALDEAYPLVVAECCSAIAMIRGRRPNPRPDTRSHCVRVDSTWKQWACYFPQHGPGRKHHRNIRLAEWQQAIVDREPGSFLRGLIHSDGWRGINKVHVKGRDYEYPRYQFSNRSDDIRRLFTDTCDRLGVKWRPWTRYHVSVAERHSVAILDRHIGPKC
jgi:hypothetical protein